MGRWERISGERGFTIVEVMVAMVVLVVGLLGTVTLLDRANAATSSNRAREGAVAVTRELTEAARGISYDQLTQGNIVSAIRAKPGFAASAINGSGWQMESRGVTYTMSVGVCSVDDANDGLGARDSTFCAGTGATTAANCRSGLGRDGNISGNGTLTGTAVGDCGIDLDKDGQVDNLSLGDLGLCSTTCSGGGTQDLNPDDYKRVVTLVRWSVGDGARFVLESTSLPYPGLSGAPRINSLTPVTPATLTIDPTTASGATTASYKAVTNRQAAGVSWLIDGTPNGNATSSDNVNWAFTWNLGNTGCSSSASAPVSGEVVDGPYLLGAKATDTFSQAGPTRTQTITLNRCAPYAPTGLTVAQIGSTVEALWAANPERDIEGYALYRQQGTGTIQTVSSMSRNRNYVEASPPGSGSWSYFVAAFDKDPTGAFRAGVNSARVTLDLSNHAPLPPSGALSGSRTGTSSASISWLASLGDSDAGDSVTAYRIYRDGTTLADRYATVPAGTYTYTDTGAINSHTYYVAAVDTKGAESTKTAGIDIG